MVRTDNNHEWEVGSHGYEEDDDEGRQDRTQAGRNGPSDTPEAVSGVDGHVHGQDAGGALREHYDIRHILFGGIVSGVIRRLRRRCCCLRVFAVRHPC